MDKITELEQEQNETSVNSGGRRNSDLSEENKDDNNLDIYERKSMADNRDRFISDTANNKNTKIELHSSKTMDSNEPATNFNIIIAPNTSRPSQLLSDHKFQARGSRTSIVPRSSFIGLDSLKLQSFFSIRLTLEQEFNQVFNSIKENNLLLWDNLLDFADKSLQNLYSLQKWIKDLGYQLISMSSVSFPALEKDQWDLKELIRNFLGNNKNIIKNSNQFGTLLSNYSRQLVNISRNYAEFLQSLKGKHNTLKKVFLKLIQEMNEKNEQFRQSNDNHVWIYYNYIFAAWKCWVQLKTMIKESAISYKELEPLEKDKTNNCKKIIEDFWQKASELFFIEKIGSIPNYNLFPLTEIKLPNFPNFENSKLIRFRSNLVDKSSLKEIIMSEEGYLVLLDVSQAVPKPELNINLKGALVEIRGVEVFVGSTRLRFESEEKAQEFAACVGCI